MRNIKLLGTIEIFNNVKTLDINLKIYYNDVAKLLMELQLLEYKLSDEFKIKSQVTSDFFLVKICQNTKHSRYIVNNQNIVLALSLNDIQAISSFLLQYFRDCSAPVNHIHVYLDNKSNTEKEAKLSIISDEYLPGYSADEARLLLQDD